MCTLPCIYEFVNLCISSYNFSSVLVFALSGMVAFFNSNGWRSSFRVRNSLKDYVGDVDVAAVPCGFGRAIGNKVCQPLHVQLPYALW